MNTIVPLTKTPVPPFNPLDDFEELIEASGYDYERATLSRLHFNCSGKHGDYNIMLEWNGDVDVIKCSLIIIATQNTDTVKLNEAIMKANESAWHGFFLIDGVGNSVFKNLVSIEVDNQNRSIFIIEESIDNAISEADRLCLSLALSGDKDNNDDLFSNHSETDLDKIELLFSDIKGNA